MLRRRMVAEGLASESAEKAAQVETLAEASTQRISTSAKRVPKEMSIMKKAMIALLCLGAAAIIGGCAKASNNDATPDQDAAAVQEETTSEATDANEGSDDNPETSPNANTDLIKAATGYDDDCCAGAAETLEELNTGDLASFELAPDRSYTYRAETVDGNVYYLEFGELGYLEVVRADAIDGEVVWGVID